MHQRRNLSMLARFAFAAEQFARTAMEAKTRLTRKELAARLRLKPETLAHWAVAGRGPKYLVINGRVLYDLDELERWERERTHRSTAEYETGPRGKALTAGAAKWNEQRRAQRESRVGSP